MHARERTTKCTAGHYATSSTHEATLQCSTYAEPFAGVLCVAMCFVMLLCTAKAEKHVDGSAHDLASRKHQATRTDPIKSDRIISADDNSYQTSQTNLAIEAAAADGAVERLHMRTPKRQ